MLDASLLPTLEKIRDWWKEHPDALAICRDPAHCIVAEPLSHIYNQPVTFVPGDTSVQVWHKHRDMELAILYLPHPKQWEDLGDVFDEQPRKTLNGVECLALIEERMAIYDSDGSGVSDGKNAKSDP